MLESLTQIGANVWLFPADENPESVQPNVGVVVTSAGTVLIGAGNSPRMSGRIRLALEAIQAPPVAYLIYTHHHWDHVFGAQTFAAPAVAHTLCRELLEGSASRAWSSAYLEEEMRRNPALIPTYAPLQRAVDDWQSFRIVLPSLTFTNDLTLYVGDTAVSCEHVGGQHAPDSIVVRLRGTDISFVGDCYAGPPLPHDTLSADLDRDIIRRLLADKTAQTFVDGHTPAPQSRAALAALLDGG